MFELILKWFSLNPSFSVILADIFFFALGILLALRLGTRKTPIYLLLSAAVVYAVCSIMLITSTEYLVLFPVFIGAMAALMFLGNLVGFIIRLIKKEKPVSK